MSKAKPSYKIKEWDEREQYYVDEIDDMTIATQPTTTDVKTVMAHIDSVLSEALLDLAYIERTISNLDRKLKNLKESLYIDVKTSIQTKLTEAEVKSLVLKELEKRPYDNGSSANIFNIIDIAEKRYIFMKRVVEILKEKKNSLVTDNAMLKIEAGIQ